MAGKYSIGDAHLEELIRAGDPASGESARLPQTGLLDRAGQRPFNPLADEPHPAVIASVKRFGLVGLLFCALTAPFIRALRSITRALR